MYRFRPSLVTWISIIIAVKRVLEAPGQVKGLVWQNGIVHTRIQRVTREREEHRAVRNNDLYFQSIRFLAVLMHCESQEGVKKVLRDGLGSFFVNPISSVRD